MKRALTKTTARKAEFPYGFDEAYFFQLQMSFPQVFILASGTCMLFESNTAHVTAVTVTILGTASHKLGDPQGNQAGRPETALVSAPLRARAGGWALTNEDRAAGGVGRGDAAVHGVTESPT